MNQLLKLKEKWELEGIETTSLANDDGISLFESVNNIRLPKDLKEYFKQVNGTNDQSDSSFFQFYSLAGLNKINEAYNDWHGVPDYRKIVYTLNEYKQYYVFANYSIHLFCYAIKLNSNDTLNEVLVICGSDYKKIANSFTEFLDLFLSESDELQM